MPYVRSKARKSFDNEIDSINRLVKKTFSGRAVDVDIRNFVLGHAIVLGFAKLEQYLQDLIVGFFQEVNRAGIKTEGLPRQLRAFLFHEENIAAPYRHFVVFKDEDRFLQSMTAVIGSASLGFMVDGNPAPSIPPQKIYAGSKYPSPRNLVRLFRRLGIRNIFHEINRLSGTDLKIKLTSFNDIRVEIAHVGALVGKNDEDVKNLLNDLRQIVRYIDRRFRTHACKIASSLCWPT
jgi:hypothetical protein